MVEEYAAVDVSSGEQEEKNGLTNNWRVCEVYRAKENGFGSTLNVNGDGNESEVIPSKFSS